MKKKIFILVGHPSKESFSNLIGEEYLRGAKESGAETRTVHLSDMKFNPSLDNGYKKEQKLEKDLVDFQKNILWADHLVFIYPIWWGGEPAKLKGLIERTFLPGFAFKFEKRSILPKQFLKGKSARVILIKGGSRLFYFGSLAYPGMIIRRFVLNFTGIFPVRIKSFYNMNSVSGGKKSKIMKKVFNLGRKTR